MPTNLDYIIAALTGEIDDGGTSFESVVHYNIDCPHVEGETDLPCDNPNVEPCRDICVPCKIEWLYGEYDEW